MAVDNDASTPQPCSSVSGGQDTRVDRVLAFIDGQM
jgi:hypothetical protein